MTNLWKGALFGGLTVFVWSAASWMVLPWHAKVFHTFEHDVDVVRMLDFGAPTSGVYLYPSASSHEMKAGEPMVFVNFSKEGMRPMGRAMGFGLALQILGAFILTWLLSKTSGLSYGQKVLFAAAYGLAVAVLGHGAYWIWWAFPTDYTLVAIAEGVMGWILAGLVIGMVI
jgi:hypothetical protein